MTSRNKRIGPSEIRNTARDLLTTENGVSKCPTSS